MSTNILYLIGLVDVLLSVLVHAEEMATKYSDNFATLPKPRVLTLEIETSLKYFRYLSDVIVSDVAVLFLLQSNKPIMEKRRRARINNCLNDLKTLILDAMKKDVSNNDFQRYA